MYSEPVITADSGLSVEPPPSLIPRPRWSGADRHDALARLSDARVVVVGINYAPEPTGIAPYTTGMAEHFASRVRSVTVLAGMPHYPWWTIPSAYRLVLRARETARLPNHKGLLLRRLRHYVPRRQTALTRAGYELSFLANAWGVRIRHSPDLIVAVTPSLGGAVAAARLARRHDAKLAIVVQDLMAKAAAQSGISGGGRAARVTGRLERYAISRADRVAIVSEAFREQIRGYGVPDERITLLPNWTHVERSAQPAAEARAALGWPVDAFTVVHTGNIGLKQDLGNLVEAARRLQADGNIRLVLVGDGSQRRAVQALARGLPNLAFVDPLDEATYPTGLAAADVLMLNERPGVGDMSLPSKLTSYLGAGRPVLAAVAPDGASARELARTGGAAALVAPGRPEEIAAAVRGLRADPRRCASMAAAGQRYAIANLGKDAASHRLDALLLELLDD